MYSTNGKFYSGYVVYLPIPILSGANQGPASPQASCRSPLCFKSLSNKCQSCRPGPTAPTSPDSAFPQASKDVALPLGCSSVNKKGPQTEAHVIKTQLLRYPMFDAIVPIYHRSRNSLEPLESRPPKRRLKLQVDGTCALLSVGLARDIIPRAILWLRYASYPCNLMSSHVHTTIVQGSSL